MEEAKEKDDPAGTTLTDPGIFMRLKSNILNRLPNKNVHTSRIIHMMNYLEQGLNEGPRGGQDACPCPFLPLHLAG